MLKLPTGFEVLPLAGAELALDGQWLSPPQADALYRELLLGVAWASESIRIAGRWIPVPRQVAWYGDPGARYRYSGVWHEPLPWLPALAGLRDRLTAEGLGDYNAVLCNWYRDGRDSMGWHSDDEPELGPDPWVISLSLGACRRFLLRHKKQPRQVPGLDLSLTHGSCLWMGPGVQRFWRHAVPKQAQAGSRINLTFRRVLAPT